MDQILDTKLHRLDEFHNFDVGAVDIVGIIKYIWISYVAGKTNKLAHLTLQNFGDINLLQGPPINLFIILISEFEFKVVYFTFRKLTWFKLLFWALVSFHFISI